MKKISLDSPSLEFAGRTPQLYFKQGSRYRRALSAEVLGATVLLLQDLGASREAFALQMRIPSIIRGEADNAG